MTEQPNVHLVEITEETARTIMKLEVAEEQKQFVASNAVSIAQAYFTKRAWFRAIYAGDTPVGFVMLSIITENPEYDLWRFMIDRHHQGNGYGLTAMRLVIDYVRKLPGAKKLELSYHKGPGDPRPFYEKLGFVDTGQMYDGEHIMELVF